MTRIIAPLALLTLISIVQSAAAADLVRYYVTDLGTLPGGNASYANAINNRGQVVGSSYVQNASNQNVPYPVLYNNGKVQMLGASAGSAWAINNAGKVVGESSGLAFLYNGTMQNLGTIPGETSSVAYGINDFGEIVGEASNNGLSQAFLYNGTMHGIGTLPGYSYAEAQGVNDLGEIVGWSYNFVSSGGLGVHSVMPFCIKTEQ
jgi:probable HAF family extracellular repeat protein